MKLTVTELTLCRESCKWGSTFDCFSNFNTCGYYTVSSCIR